MADWRNILSDNNEQLSEEDLLKYLDDDLSQEEKHSIENRINNSPFEVDALQGLLQVKNKKHLQKHVNQLNQKLQHLTAKRQRKEKRKIKIFKWVILTLLILLFTCVVGYVIIRLHVRSNINTKNLNSTTKVLTM
ncbi:hypothetical protein [Segetibacter aerophilus]|uniref:Uncharacterized protein n=1 Tax=Segetibacter aerophilus TaxID=670293 RepID=A0A512BDT3_9BACT|nr:hypothetical protein [Segetibacter aerophilus]GEO10129.1 hypothetical protein SAE01_26250 [Segetibacter aerophilus]